GVSDGFHLRRDAPARIVPRSPTRHRGRLREELRDRRRLCVVPRLALRRARGDRRTGDLRNPAEVTTRARHAKTRVEVKTMADEIRTFEDFWPHYVRAHSSKGNRTMHFIGTSAAMVLAGTGVLTGNWLLVGAAPV